MNSGMLQIQMLYYSMNTKDGAANILMECHYTCVFESTKMAVIFCFMFCCNHI